MEANQGSVTVTVNYGALTCAAEAMATLLVSALVKSQLLAPVCHFCTLFSHSFLAENTQKVLLFKTSGVKTKKQLSKA